MSSNMTEEDEEEEGTSPMGANRSEKLKFLAGTFAKITNGVGKTIGRTAASAGELLGDAELRRKGAALFAREAAKGIKGIQSGLGNAAEAVGRTLQTGAHGISQGPKQVQAVLARIQKRIEEQRLAEMIEATRHQPVDVQMGNQLYEDAPQDLRTRLWCVLLESPDLGEVFRPMCVPHDQVPPQDQRRLSSRLSRIHSSRSKSSADSPTSGAVLAGENNENSSSSPIGAPSDSAPIVCPLSNQANKDETNQNNEDGAFLEDDWQLVPSMRQNMAGRKSSSFSSEPAVTPQGIGVQVLNAAMLDLTWPLPTEWSPDSRYGTLLQITIGMDEEEDIINRDIHRTFPEHPHFNGEQGRNALFNVLKAYSVHDLEVGYCQGMAFVAGVLLMYVPQEIAFRLLCRLLDSDGAGMRKLYLPGLATLKHELMKLEWVIEKHLPILHAHLESNGIPAVLYASQWFLTCFACPFPPSFVARVIDIMLIENDMNALQRVSFAVLSECAEDVIQLNDFEEILTCLKVKPMEWSAETARRVLSYSLACPITDEEIEVADAAIQAEESAIAASDAFKFSRMRSEEQDVPKESSNEESAQNGEGEAVGDDGKPQLIEMLSDEFLEMLWDTDHKPEPPDHPLA